MEWIYRMRFYKCYYRKSELLPEPNTILQQDEAKTIKRVGKISSPFTKQDSSGSLPTKRAGKSGSANDLHLFQISIQHILKIIRIQIVLYSLVARYYYNGYFNTSKFQWFGILTQINITINYYNCAYDF